MDDSRVEAAMAAEAFRGGGVHVHVDHRHMGVGGDDSWTPCVHPEFLVPSGQTWRWGLTLAALPSGGDAFETHRALQSRQL